MASKRYEAVIAFDAAAKELQKFCEDNTDLEVFILTDQYPIRVQFIPVNPAQTTMFGDNNVSDTGEVNDLVVTVGLNTYVQSTLKFKMDSKLLKKLIKRAVSVGTIYYQAFRERYAMVENYEEVTE